MFCKCCAFLELQDVQTSPTFETDRRVDAGLEALAKSEVLARFWRVFPNN